MIIKDNAKVGDKFFGILYVYKTNFLKGVKLVNCEIVNITPKNIDFAWDNESRKYPQRFPKNKDIPTICINKEQLLREFMSFLKNTDWSDSLKKTIRNYCIRKLIMLRNESLNVVKEVFQELEAKLELIYTRDEGSFTEEKRFMISRSNLRDVKDFFIKRVGKLGGLK